MQELQKIIEVFPLRIDEKKSLLQELLKSKVLNLKIAQNKAFLDLESGKVIVLNNMKKEFEKSLKKIEEIHRKTYIKQRKNSNCKRVVWNSKDIKFLKDNFAKYDNKELASKLDKSIYQIQAKKISLKLYPIKPWSADEVAYLISNKDKSLYFLSEKLNRSIAAIKSKKAVCRIR